jgi:hypothetical protein
MTQRPCRLVWLSLGGFRNWSRLLHVRFRNACLRTRSQQLGVGDNFVFAAIEPVAVAIRTRRHVARNDGIATLANFEIPGRLNDLLRAGCTRRKMAI